LRTTPDHLFTGIDANGKVTENFRAQATGLLN
jgi:hypothetical protein